MAKGIVLWSAVLVLFLGTGIGADRGALNPAVIRQLSDKFLSEGTELGSWGVEGSLQSVTDACQEAQRETLRRIYLGEVGVREKTGNNDGERVGEYLKVVGLREGYSWCAAFVCWVLEEAGVSSPKNGWSPALFPQRRLVWRRDGAQDRAQQPAERVRPPADDVSIGDVFGIYYPNLKRIGHCGFIDRWSSTTVITVEGNTGPDGTVNARDGPAEGVHRKRRPQRTIYAVADWVGEGFE